MKHNSLLYPLIGSVFAVLALVVLELDSDKPELVEVERSPVISCPTNSVNQWPPTFGYNRDRIVHIEGEYIK